MIEQGHAHLEAHRHAGAVDLGEEVVGQICQRIQQHHALDEIRKSLPQAGVAQPVAGVAGERHEPFRLRPQRNEAAIGRVGVVLAQQRRQLLRLLLRQRRPQPRRREARQAAHGILGEQAQHAGSAAAQRARRGERAPDVLAPSIAGISGEELVAAVARERHGDVPARETRDDLRRDLRGIGEGLVVPSRQRRDDLARGAILDIELGMLGAEMGRHLLGVAGLVESIRGEADGEGLHRARAFRLHQRGDERRIDAARQERAERHIRHHLVAHRAAQRALELAQESGFVRLARGIEAKARGRLLEIPVALEPWVTIAAEREHHSRLELVHAAIDAMGRRHVAEAQEGGDGVRIDLRAPVGMAVQRLQLRAEQERAPGAAPIERLDPEPVADQRELALLAIPQRQREHPLAFAQCRHDAPAREALDQHFRIRMAAQHDTVLAQALGKLAVIVDLAVIGDDIAAIGAGHRLVPGGTDVDDGEAAVAEGDARFRVDPHAAIIGTAMTQRFGHRGNHGLPARPSGRTIIEEAGDAAHLPVLCRGRR